MLTWAAAVFFMVSVFSTSPAAILCVIDSSSRQPARNSCNWRSNILPALMGQSMP